MIAHRLTTIHNADLICVLGKSGVILELGTHEQLMKKKAVYYSLYKKGLEEEKSQD